MAHATEAEATVAIGLDRLEARQVLMVHIRHPPRCSRAGWRRRNPPGGVATPDGGTGFLSLALDKAYPPFTVTSSPVSPCPCFRGFRA